MTRETVITLVDDLEGGPADETVTFGLDGTSYEIDLSAHNAGKLRNALAEYVGEARRVGSGSGRGRRTAGTTAPRRAAGNESAEIRAWARQNGYEVNERGRIPGSVVDAFRAQQ